MILLVAMVIINVCALQSMVYDRVFGRSGRRELTSTSIVLAQIRFAGGSSQNKGRLPRGES